MTTLQDQVDITYSDFNVIGLPSSGEKEPQKPEIRTLMYGVLSAIDSITVAAAIASGAVVFYATIAAMNADLAHIDGTVGIVTDDPLDANNGIYRKIGTSGSGSWSNTGLVTMASIRGDLDNLQTTKDEVDVLFAQMTAALATMLATATTVAAQAAATAANTALAAQYRDEAITARDDAVAAVAMATIYKFYNTYALANADITSIPANGYVGVWADETRSGSPQAYYQKVGGVLTFVIEMPIPAPLAAFGGLPGYGATYSDILSRLSVADQRVDSTINLPNVDTNLNLYIDHKMVGSGEVWGFTGKMVIPDNAPPASTFNANNCNFNAFPRINAKSDILVIHVGDSLFTPSHNNNFIYNTGVVGYIEAQMRAQAGSSRNLTFLNYSLGGATFGSVLGTMGAGTQPPWNTDITKKWAFFINKAADDWMALYPTTGGVLINWGFGMNVDTSLIWTLSNLAPQIACLSYADQLFNTNLMPSSNASNPNASTQDDHIGQASIIRNWCLKNGYAFIDHNQFMIMARDGYDIRSNRPYENFANSIPTGFTITPPGTMVGTLSGGAFTPQRPVDGGSPVDVKCINFNWVIDVKWSDWDSTGNNSLYMQVGANQNDVLQITKTVGGTLTVALNHGDSVLGVTVTSQVTGWTPGDNASVGYKTIVVEASDNMITVRSIEKDANGNLGIYPSVPIFSAKSLRKGTRFTPSITTTGTGRPVTRVRFDHGRHVAYMPIISNLQAWGISTSDLPDEGTGDNHNTNTLSAMIEQYCIRQATFFTSAAICESGTWTPTLVFTTGTGPATFIDVTGTYRKIGRLTHCRVQVGLSALNGATGSLKITSPFTNAGISGAVNCSCNVASVAVTGQMATTSGVTYITVSKADGTVIPAGNYYYIDFIIYT